MPRVVAICNQKGGVGKTTTACNLAQGLADEGWRTLLVDLDGQGSATLMMGLDPRDIHDANILHVFQQEMTIAEVLQDLEPNLAVIGAELSLVSDEPRIAMRIGANMAVRMALEAEDCPFFDFVILDCPPNLGLCSQAGVMACHDIIVPCEPSIMSFAALPRLQEVICDAERIRKEAINRYGLLTRVRMWQCQDQEALDIIQEMFNDGRFLGTIRQNVRVAEAAEAHTTIMRYDPNAIAARDYRQLVDVILDLHDEEISEMRRNRLKVVSHGQGKTRTGRRPGKGRKAKGSKATEAR